MGRKNKRIITQNDKSFEKFLKNFESEKNQKNIRQQQTVPIKKQEPIKDTNIDYEKRNLERLEYVKKQLDLFEIQYRVVDEKTTLIYCNRKSDGYVIKYYASNGFIVGHRDFRGINSLIQLLTQQV